MLVRPLAALAASAALLLAGCGDDDPAPRAADPTPPASTAPATTLAPVVETPEEFVRRWVEHQTSMQNSGQTGPFRAASSDSCSECRDLADLVNKIHRAGGFIKTEGWIVRAIECTSSDGVTRCEARVTGTRTQYANADGAMPQTLPGGSFREAFEMRREEGEWKMVRIAELAA